MLITPYRIFAVVGVVQSRLYTIDCYGCNVFVIYEVGQSNITDSAFVILYALQQSAGVISFQRFVGCFFSTAQSELLEESAGTAGSRTGNQNNRFIRAANLFPVGYLSGEDVGQLSLGQAFYFSCQIFVDNRSHGNYANLMVYKSFGNFGFQLAFCRYIRVTDVNAAVRNLFQTGAAAAAVKGDGNIRVNSFKFACCILCQRQKCGRTAAGYTAGNLAACFVICSLVITAAAQSTECYHSCQT